MINQDTVRNLSSIINHLKNTDGYKYLVMYFEEKMKEIVNDMIKQAGNLEKESLIEANAKLQVYEELLHFDILLSNELK